MARNRKLGSLKPSRFREIAEQERRIYEKTLRAWRGAKQHILRVLGFPNRSALAAEEVPFILTPEMEAAIDRAASWFIKAHIGNAIDAQAFAQPSAAAIDVQTPFWNGKPILPGELRTAFRVGQERAVKITGADAPSLLGIRNEDAQQQLLRSAFARLSDGARVTLADALTSEDRAGGSIRSVLRAAMNDGKNPLQTAKDLRKQFDKIEGYDWARLARTETAFSQNFAMEAEYAASGYVLPRGEDGEPIETPPFHPNCFPEGTMVEADGICGALRMYYEGELSELILADGSTLSATVNHPLLTPSGFKAAGSMGVGDHIIQRRSLQRVGGGNPDVERRPAVLENVFIALSETSGMATYRVPLAAEDVHGDAQFGDGYVDIVAPDSFLRDRDVAHCAKHGGGNLFSAAGSETFGLPCRGDLTAMFLRMALTADCRVSRPDHPLSGLCVHPVEAALLGGTARPNLDADLHEAVADSSAVGSETLGQVLDALSGQVAPCEIVQVRRVPFSGHVYDLQTFGSLYIANTVLASNCLCGLTIDPETGQILLDVAATACFVCQAHLAEQLTITTGRDVAPATPVTAVQPEPPPWVQRRLSGEDE